MLISQPEWVTSEMVTRAIEKDGPETAGQASLTAPRDRKTSGIAHYHGNLGVWRWSDFPRAGTFVATDPIAAGANLLTGAE